MARFDFDRLAAWLSGLWAGVLLGIGAIAAPAGFAAAPREIAGSIAGRMFAQEAYLSLAMAVVMYLLLRRTALEAHVSDDPGQQRRIPEQCLQQDGQQQEWHRFEPDSEAEG